MPLLRLPEPVDRFDEIIDAAWEPLRASGLANRAMYGASQAADFSLLWHAIGIGLAASGRNSWRQSLRLSVLLGVESLVVNQGLKRLFERPRPQVDPSERPLHLRQPSTSSFPSGHASAACVAATLLSEHEPAARPVWWGLAGLVATSRLHVRIHHGSDVLAGAVSGLGLAAILRRLWADG